MGFSAAFTTAFRGAFSTLAAGLTFLLRDDFVTALSAGSVNGTAAEPGPGGNRTVVDTENKMPITGGALVFGSKASPAFGDPGIWYATQSRITGLAYHARLNHLDINLRSLFGWYLASGGALPHAGFYYQIGGAILVFFGTGGNLTVGTHATGSRDIFVIQRSTGYFFVEKVGGVYTLYYVSSVGATATLYPGATNFASADPVDTIRVIDLPANGYTVWSDDYGIATERYAGSVSAGQVFTHEANCLIEWTVATVPTGGGDQLGTIFRKQDASNYWFVWINSSGQIVLTERAAAVNTSRGLGSGVLSGHRIVIVADGTTIRIYANNVLKITYTSASNFQTQTTGETVIGASGSISDLISWPRVLSGEAADSLDAVVEA